MAPLFFTNREPRKTISPLSTPAPLVKALKHVCKQAGEGLWLVGGTALAGYYADHRRSDDLDLFAINPPAHRAAVLAAQSLKAKGADFSNELNSAHYYHANVDFLGHAFTLDVVLDENLGRVSKAHHTKDHVWVASLSTLFAMKAACLVSRCSEKDLFDLDWLFGQAKKVTLEEMIHAGQEIDSGLGVESLLISLQGAILRQEACHFLLPQSKLSVRSAYNRILAFRKKLVGDLLEYEKHTSLSSDVKTLAAAVKERKKNSF